MYRLPLLLLSLVWSVSGFATMVNQTVAYSLDGTDYEGVLVYDDAVTTPRPALLMVPNWYGVNQAAIGKAQGIAGQDYVILLADVYGKNVRPANASEAGAAVGPLLGERPRLRARAQAALAALRAVKGAPIDPARIAAIGFCFGGTTVLDLARDGADIAAAVSFHGGLSTDDPALARQIKAAVLAMDGADDAATIGDAPAFREEMRQSPADWQFVVFGHAVHCFTEVGEDSPNCRYDEKSARRSDRLMRQWLEEAFAAGGGTNH